MKIDCKDCGQEVDEGNSLNGYCPTCVDKFAESENRHRLIQTTRAEAEELYFALNNTLFEMNDFRNFLNRRFRVETPEGISKLEYVKKYKQCRSLSVVIDEWKSKLKVYDLKK